MCRAVSLQLSLHHPSMWQTYGKMTGGQLTSFTRLYCQTQLYWHYALISLATCGPCWIDFVQHKASMLLICRPPNANLIWCQLWNDSHWPDSTSTIAFCICQQVHRLNAPMTLLHCMRKINMRLCYCVICCSKINVQMNIGMQISCDMCNAYPPQSACITSSLAAPVVHWVRW